jgi:hypothetical protein
MSSPPLSEPGNRAGLFFQAAGSFVSRFACPRPWSRIRKHPGAPGFVLRGLVILSRHVLAHDERIGGGPVLHARLTELERLADPSAPCLVTPHPAADPIPRAPPRAELRRSTRPSQSNSCSSISGSVNSLETGSESPLGNIFQVF